MLFRSRRRMVVKRQVLAYVVGVVLLQIIFVLLTEASILPAMVVRRLVPAYIPAVDNGKHIAGRAWQRQPQADED